MIRQKGFSEKPDGYEGNRLKGKEGLEGLMTFLDNSLGMKYGKWKQADGCRRNEGTHVDSRDYGKKYRDVEKGGVIYATQRGRSK